MDLKTLFTISVALEARAVTRILLCLANLDAGQGMTTSALAEETHVSTRQITRCRSELESRGLVVVEGGQGGSDAVWSLAERFHSQLPLEKADLDHLAVQAGKKKRQQRKALTFNGVRYRSPLERNVAVVLYAIGASFTPEVPYKALGVATDKAWAADFVVKASTRTVAVKGVVEVAGVKGVTDYQSNLKAKTLALRSAGIPVLEVRTEKDLRNLPSFMERLSKLATEKEVTKAEAAEKMRDPNRPYETSTGVYVDPRAINRKKKRRAVSVKPVVESSPDPSESYTSIVEDPVQRELQRATEALDNKRWREMADAKAAVEKQLKAKWAAEDAKADRPPRVKLLEEALAWAEQERRRVQEMDRKPVTTNGLEELEPHEEDEVEEYLRHLREEGGPGSDDEDRLPFEEHL